tara:strand:- start:344 stop:700 length:357 start_codon:yes stop_codon:yes gene_type:complete
MGYRSKVIIGVKTGDLSKEFDNILRKHEFSVDKPDGDYIHVHEDPNDKTFYTFNYIKWYESDDWCREIVDWLEKVNAITGETDSDVFCIGLGEDGVSHSHIGCPYEYVEQISEINLID